ncbi:MAG: CHAP domain-containing protein [Phycisphaerae bacterium]
MYNLRQVSVLFVSFILAVACRPGCTVSVSNAGGGRGDSPLGGNPPIGGDNAPGSTDTGSAGGDLNNPSQSTVQQLVDEPGVADAFRFAGDGIAAKRALMPGLFDELDELQNGGSEAAEAMLERFAGERSFEEDEELFLLAYALEQMNYTAGIDRLVTFLEQNITNALPATLAGVTHAVRSMTGMTLSPTFFYHVSDIEETIASAGGGALMKLDSVNQDNAGHTKDAGLGLKGNLKICYREFILQTPDGKDAVWPEGHPQAGQPIKLTGTILPSDATIRPQDDKDERDRVNAGGGTYVDFTDPANPDVTWDGRPNRLFNCAGFAFRRFNDGGKWNAAPANWFSALRTVGAIEPVASDAEAAPGDFVFYFAGGDLPAHVAEVQSSAGGNVTVINADRWSGLFTADADAEYFFGSNIILQRFGVGLAPRYSQRQVWRWTGGIPPALKPNVERQVQNSCHGEDTNGDGFPETDTCIITQRCLEPAFIFGAEGPDLYVIMNVTNYGSAEGGYLTVRTESSIDDPPLLSSFPGGGINPELLAQWTPFTEGRFDSPEEAAASICDGFSDFFRPVLASFILEGVWNGTNYGVDGVFESVCETP